MAVKTKRISGISRSTASLQTKLAKVRGAHDPENILDICYEHFNLERDSSLSSTELDLNNDGIREHVSMC